MDSISFLLFLIFTIVILITLVFISPIVSAGLMIGVPLIFGYILPEPSVQFFSMQQFTYMGVPIYNIHILMLLWSALIGIVVYSELLSWYLLADKTVPDEVRKKAKAALIQSEPPKTTKNKIEDFLLKLGKIMSGGK
ncbi:MAG: hypothetical protein O8C60_05885 [Candidatus Methanoperedens sp.]|nr:hypothetical protein [Candidatus Methanoperedens sp.]